MSTTTTSTAATHLEELFCGAQLWKPSTCQMQDATSVIRGKIVLLYFSAYWCAPCSYFTPVLIEFYHKIRQQHGSDCCFEVVYCGMDRTQAQYREYIKKMPWFCVPFGQTAVTSKLVSRFEAHSIPYLVVMDTDGRTVLTKDGVGQVSMDPDGLQFPWRPAPLTQILPKHFWYNGRKRIVTPMSSLRHKYILFYFAAQWCAPCRELLPALTEAYRRLQSTRTDFEMIFVSADKSLEDFNEHYGEMPFGAIPFELADVRQTLVKRFEIRGYPTVLVWSPEEGRDGKRHVINPNCRGVLEDGGDSVLIDFPYHPKPYGNLKAAPEDINNHECVIVFHENGDDEDQKGVREVLRQASRQLQGIKCYWVLEQSHVSKSVRQAVGLPVQPTGEAKMILLDLPKGGTYYMSAVDDITVDNVLSFTKAPGLRREIR